MDTKITLKLDREVIEQVKKYAHRKNVSLSKMVEKYFKPLVDEEKKNGSSIRLSWKNCPELSVWKAK